MFDRKAYQKEYCKEYNKRDYVKTYHKRYGEEHREERRAYQKGWYGRNRERLIAKSLERQRRWYDALKMEVLTHYSSDNSPSCIICGEDRLPCLSIDHINNDGAKHRKEIGSSGKNFYKWLKERNYPEGYQVLCMNCQFLKEHTRRRKEC